jgi:hypothetical protein
MRLRTLALLLVSAFSLRANTDLDSHPANFTPIPFLTWTDVKDLYSNKVRAIKGKQPGDWDYPKLKSYPNEVELVKFCERDLALSLRANPDPFQLGHSLPSGNLMLDGIYKDPDNQMVYFVFEYDSELITDLHVVYYYDLAQGCFILKSTR